METFKLIVDIFTSIAVIFAGIVMVINIKQLIFQRKSFQADLFHKIHDTINFAYEKRIEATEKGDDAIVNALYRLMNAYEYFSFFANRELLTKHMIEYYKYSLVDCCDEAAKYKSFERFYKDIEDAFFEIKQLYKKFSDKPWPLNINNNK